MGMAETSRGPMGQDKGEEAPPEVTFRCHPSVHMVGGLLTGRLRAERPGVGAGAEGD